MNKNLAFYVRFHIKPEYVEQWKEEAKEVITKMSKEDTFVSCYMHEEKDDPTRFSLYEVWNEPSMEAFIKNQLEAKDYRHEYEKTLSVKLQSERTFVVLDTMQEWHK